ncbi:hypothetical protein PTKIN_Ptkin02bG0247200 [Pterospermum kingtungense]
MALEVSDQKAAEIAIASIGCGYDLASDLRLKYCKKDGKDSRLIEFDDVGCYDLPLPSGISIPNVSKLIKCSKGERIRFRSDVLSFQQMSEQFNYEMSLAGKIPSGLFNTMFDFSGCWQKDAANTKTLAFDGMFITFYTISLEKSRMVLHDHVKKAVPSSWDPAACARFIKTFGTHIIVGVEMGGKDVLYLKQQHSSIVTPVDIHTKLMEMADEKFLENNGQNRIDSERVELNNEGISIIYKRRGGREDMKLSHSEWLHTVQVRPDVVSMSFIPITSLLNGVHGSGFLTCAINLYLRYKPPLEELHMFLEFQLVRQWAPDFNEYPLRSRKMRQNDSFVQFKFLGPKLYVNTIQVDVGKRPVTGLRLNLEGQGSNRLAVCVQHLSSLPNCFQLVDDPGHTFFQGSYDEKHFEKVGWKYYSRVCTAPVECNNDHSIVTGAQLQVEKYGVHKALFLRLRFCTVSGAVVRHSEWDESFGFTPEYGSFEFAPQSRVLPGFITGLVRMCLTPKPTPPQSKPDTNKKSRTRSSLYTGGPRVPNSTPKLLAFVDTSEITRGPQHPPGYWVVSGARLVVHEARIALQVKYSILQPDI